MPKQGGNQTARICCDGLRLAHSENFIIFAFMFAGHQIFWRFFSTPLTIDVKNVFNVFLFLSYDFYFFNVFFYFPNVFFIFKNVGKVQSGKQINRNLKFIGSINNRILYPVIRM